MKMGTKETSNTSVTGGAPPAEPIALVSICLDPEAVNELRDFVRRTPFLRLHAELQSYLADEGPNLSWMQEPGPDVCLIDFDRDRVSATLTAERIQEKLRNTAIFALSRNSQPDLIIQAMRCGCSEYIVKPVDQEKLLEAVARVGGRKKEKKDQFSGRILTFLGAKGGSGVTTVATHLGALLAKPLGRRALLVDLHRTCGEAALFLGLTKYQYHFYDLVESVDRLDRELLGGYVVHHSTGLDLLPSPELNEPERRLIPEAVGQVIDFIRTQYEFVLLDCAPGLNAQNVEAIRRSDFLYLVTTPEVPALRNVARILSFLARNEFAQDKVQVVVNRHSKKDTIGEEEIEKAIRKKIYWKIPNQYHQVIRTINAGDPSAHLENSEVVRCLLPWAKGLLGSPDLKTSKKPSKGLLNLFGT